MTARARRCLALMARTAGRGRLYGMLGLQVVVALMEGTALVLLVPVIQALGGRDTLSLPGLDLDMSLTTTIAAVLVVVVLRGLAQWRSAVLATDIRLATVDHLRLGLLEDLYRADWGYLAGKQRGRIVQQLTTDVERAHSAFAMVVRLLVGSLVLLATAAVAVVVAPLVGGLAVAAVAVVALLASRTTRTAHTLGREMTERLEIFGATVSDSLASARVMRAHDAANAWSDLVEEEAARVREVRHDYVNKGTGVGSALAVTGVVAVLTMLLVGREVGLTLAQIATLAVVANRMLSTAQTLFAVAQQFANDVGAVERLEEFHAEIKLHPERVLDGGPSSPRSGAGGTDLLSLRGIVAGYATEDNDLDPVLVDVDLDIPRKGLVTVVGPSGAGKSTLLDVVLGLRTPQRGEVLIDGEPLVDLAAWRARIGYVPQQTVLVPGTVWQNLTWSMQPGRSLSEDEAWTALETACVADVVRGLPGGLQAPLQELAELSGGEQQRLSIARALVREPDLLVLDEATSALDRDTEERLLAAVLDGSRAVLMVTHRELGDREGTVLRLG